MGYPIGRETTVRDQSLATRRVTGATGLAVAILFGAGNALWAFDQPHGGDSTAKVIAFYTDSSSRIVAGASLSLVSIALFVFFAAGLRSILREHEKDDLFATAAFGGAVLAMATGIGAETINMVGALRAADGQLTPELGRTLFEISYVLGFNAAGVGIGIVLLATATVALRARALLPRWFALTLVVVGVAFVTPLSLFLLGPAVLALAVVSVQLLRTSGGASARMPRRA
jgi:hypothetical protein